MRPAVVTLLAVLWAVAGPPAGRSPAAPQAGTEWYFAEGTTLPGWTEYLTLLDPGPAPADVTITYFLEGTGGASAGSRQVAVGLRSYERRTVAVNDPPERGGAGPGFTGVAVRIQATAPVVVERPEYLDAVVPGVGRIVGSHTAAGVAAPQARWYFAEGTTLPGFREYLALFNPGGADAAVTVHYLTDRGPLLDRAVTVPAGARRTVDVVDDAGPGLAGVAAVVDASTPIVAERPIYVARTFAGRGLVTGATVSPGAAQPASAWSFAEGTTLDAFAEYLTVLDPGPTSAQVDLAYRVEGGVTVTRTVGVAAGARLTVTVFDPTDPGGIGRDLADGTLGEGVAVTASVREGSPVVAERAVYWNRGGATGAHAALGHAGPPATEYLFAEGTTRPGFQQFWTFDNPGQDGLTVTVTYFLGGVALDRVVTVPAGQRVTTRAEDDVGPGADFGAMVRAERPFLVERPIYGGGPGGADGDIGTGVSL